MASLLLDNWGSLVWSAAVFVLGVFAANLKIIKEVFLWIAGLLESKNLSIISNTSVIDPFFEFYPGHHTSVNECIFTIKNVSGRSLKFEVFNLNISNSNNPYVIISSPNEDKKGLVYVDNTQSYEKTFPDRHIDGSDFSMSYIILNTDEVLRITVEDRGFANNYIGALIMKQHRDSDSIAGKRNRKISLKLYKG